MKGGDDMKNSLAGKVKNTGSQVVDAVYPQKKTDKSVMKSGSDAKKSK